MKTHKVVRIKVCCDKLILVQSHQIVKATGGRRDRKFPNISETIELGEYPINAAVRGIQEELGGLNIDTERFTLIGFFEEIKPSPTTGEIKQYLFWDYSLELTPDEAEKVPLETDEGEVITYFEWRPQ